MNAADIMAALQKHKVSHFAISADLSRSGEERCQWQWYGTAEKGEEAPWGFGRSATPGEALERMLEQVAESKAAAPTPLEQTA